eukprot:scaffold15863_cov27-Tisochrysis_lutea.AAC.1
MSELSTLPTRTLNSTNPSAEGMWICPRRDCKGDMEEGGARFRSLALCFFSLSHHMDGRERGGRERGKPPLLL